MGEAILRLIASGIPVFLLGAALYRMRGGWLPTRGAGIARQLWNPPTALLLTVTASLVFELGWTERLALFAACYASAWAGVANSHNGFFNVGEGTAGQVALKTAKMALLGVYRAAVTLSPVLVLMAWHGAWPGPVVHAVTGVMLLGLLQGPLYLLGYAFPVPAGNAPWPSARNNLIQGSTSWGELLWGGTQYAGYPAIILVAVTAG